jgi:hypothetical protein
MARLNLISVAFTGAAKRSCLNNGLIRTTTACRFRRARNRLAKLIDGVPSANHKAVSDEDGMGNLAYLFQLMRDRHIVESPLPVVPWSGLCLTGHMSEN